MIFLFTENEYGSENCAGSGNQSIGHIVTNIVSLKPSFCLMSVHKTLSRGPSCLLSIISEADIIYPHFAGKQTGPERASNLPEVSQLGGGRTWTGKQLLEIAVCFCCWAILC